MSEALELGIRGMVHVEAERVQRAADALSDQLVALLQALPELLERDALEALSRGVPAGLPAAEGAALAGRIAARALAKVSGPHLVAFATACGEAGRAEAERLAPFADALDVLLRVSRPSISPTLAERVQAARARFDRLADPKDPAAITARRSLALRLATDIGLSRALGALQEGPGTDLASRLHAAVRTLETPESGRVHLRRRAHLLFTPLVDVLDLHLEGVFPS